jgi:hypothetical protein
VIGRVAARREVEGLSGLFKLFAARIIYNCNNSVAKCHLEGVESSMTLTE